jgi:glycosyltransferase involved in cell wall biosynthesis
MTTSRKRRILLVDLGAYMGGVEVYLEGLAAILHPGADLFGLCVLDELANRLTQGGARVTRIPIFRSLRFLRFLAAVLVLPYLIVRHGIDVVQINGLLEAIVLLPARMLGCETVYTRHGPFETGMYKWYKQPGKFLPRILARYCVHFATHVVCVSETVGAIVRPILPKGRVTVIPNWVRKVPSFKTRPHGKSRAVNIVYVGRLERYKGLHLVLEAVRNMPKVRLTVVGDGNYRHALEQLAAGLDVTFVGFQADPTLYYENAEIFVMPSFGPEGLPMVALEAMAHALPCVFSDLPVHAEITNNGLNAVLFRTGDVADLRDKLSGLIQNSGLRQQYGERAYQAIQTHYHSAVAGPAYLKLFEVEA